MGPDHRFLSPPLSLLLSLSPPPPLHLLLSLSSSPPLPPPLPLLLSLSSHSQLFGEPDADNDVSPETEEEEGVPPSSLPSLLLSYSLSKSLSTGMVTGQRVSTRQWAENNGYDPVMLFHKVHTAVVQSPYSL